MRIVPNSYQKPNLYTDKLMWYLTGDEWKTLDYALRRTFGFNKERDRISVSQFMSGNGRLDEDGIPVEMGTGLSRTAQINALNELMRFGILIELAPDSRKRGRLWTLQLDESRIQFDLIEQRARENKALGRQRTAKAREVQQADRPSAIGLSDRPILVCQTDQYRLVGQTNSGQSDRPTLVSGTDPQKPRRNPEERQGETQLERRVAEAWRLLVDFCEGNEQTAAAVWRLQERFAEVTQLKRPDPASPAGLAKLQGEWWPHLRQVLADADDEPEAAEAAMQEAFKVMVQRPQPLTVSGPRSIVNVTAGVLAEKRRGGPDGPGLKQVPKGLAGIDAYTNRRGLTHGNP